MCQGVFLEFDHEISLNFAMVLETSMKLCMTARFFGKTFAPEIGEIGKKKGFFNLKKLVTIFTNLFCNENIIFFVLAQIQYLGKILFLRFRPKCSQPIRSHGF